MNIDPRDFWYREGRTPVIRHMADRSYTIRAWVKEGFDTVEFEIYRIVPAEFGPEGSEEGFLLTFWQRYGVTLRPCAVDSLDDAEREFFGGVKEVGCADWNLNGDLKIDHHVCRREQLEQISAVLCACYDWAQQLISPRQYSAPPLRELPFLPEA